MRKPIVRSLIVGASLCLLPTANALAANDQWYIGIGGGASLLEPNPVEPNVNVDEGQTTLGTLFVGKDIDERSSIQLQLYGLGEATLDNAGTVEYNAIDASILYRLFDSRDVSLRRDGPSVSFYGRFALGHVDRNTDEPLKNDTNVYFGLGAGVEALLTRNIALRAEGLYHESDVGSFSLALVTRFGGTQRPLVPVSRPTARPAVPQEKILEPAEPIAPASPTAPEVPATPKAPPAVPVVPAVPPAPPAPQVAPRPAAPVAQTPTESAETALETPDNNDRDNDGVVDVADNCPDSTPDFPVREDGCALLDGIMSNIQFVPGTGELTQGSYEQLDFLANVLARYPAARIQLLAHTDDTGSMKDQSIVTRSRLKTIGIYLVSKGVSANRLQLRSFGGSKPVYDNATAEGRKSNNRIEVLEYIVQ